ncbi:MAG: FHA domain-containing protein, partial [Eubacterium sp.]|nr:FHA domain-containing protein [Eubacterium sp.]
AEISLREGEYYIKDTNSTNHTFINGDMIQSGVEVKISIGDRLRFANEEFEFQMR